MRNKLIVGLAAVLVLAMSLAVAGCISNNSTSNNSASNSENSGQALTMTAAQVAPIPPSVTTYYGDDAVMINVTLTNNHAGTFKVSGDDFYMQDTSDHLHQPLGATQSSILHENAWVTVPLVFQLQPGTTAAAIEYNDGTHDLNCIVSF